MFQTLEWDVASGLFGNTVGLIPSPRRTIVAATALMPISYDQDPEASLDYTVDWQMWMAPGDTLVSGSFDVDLALAVTGGPLLTGMGSMSITIFLSGQQRAGGTWDTTPGPFDQMPGTFDTASGTVSGVPASQGIRYRIVSRVVTAQGRFDKRTFYVRIQPQ